MVDIYNPNYPNNRRITKPTDKTWITPSMLPTPAVASNNALDRAFKPKRAGKNPKLSHVVFVLDDSSSMQSHLDVTISGFNEFLDSQKLDSKASGIDTVVSLYKFNGSAVSPVFERTSINDVEPLTKRSYNPSGGTNLNDAMGGVMMQVNNALATKKKSERESVIIAILTDGEENASRTFTSDNIKAMVKKAESKNWGFMFLGADINAFTASSALGFNSHNTLQFSKASSVETMRNASAMTSRMKNAYASGLDTQTLYAATGFTNEERTMSVGKSNDKESV